MPVLPYGLATLAGVCLYACCDHLQALAPGVQQRTHRLFAAMCLMIALGAGLCITMSQSQQVLDSVTRVRWIISLVCVVNILFPWFIAAYLDARTAWFAKILSGIYTTLLTANWLRPYGLWFATPPIFRMRRLPWGEQVASYFPSAFNIWRTSFWLAQAFLFAYCLILCIQQFQRGHRRRPIILGIGMSILLLACCNDWLVSVGRSNLPNTGLFGFLGLVLLMSWDLRYQQQQINKQMQAVLDQVPAVVYVKDLLGRYLFVNRHFAQLFHADAGKLLGRTDTELFTAATAESLSSHDDAVLANNQPQRFEELLEKDGALHTYLSLKFPLGDDSATVPHAIACVATDITERMRTEQALRSSEAQTRLLLDATEQGIIGVDLDGCCTFVNRAALRLLGYEQTHALHGKSMSQVIYCASNAEQNDAFAPVRHTLESGESAHFAAASGQRNDGSAFAMEYWSHPIRNKGQIVGAVLSFSDISERKRVDDAVRALAEASAALDSDAFFQYCARSLAEVYGAQYAMIGLFVREHTRVRTVAACANNEIVANFEYAVADAPCAEVGAKTRKLVPARLTELYGNEQLKRMQVESYFGTPIVSPCGATIGVVAVLGREPLRIGRSSESMLDVFAHRISVELDRKLALDRLNELNESLELRVAERTKELSQINEELEAFSYSVSHDLRAPLTTMAGFSALLMDQYADTLDVTCKRYLQHIADGAQRMNGLIDALLSLARITQQALRLHKIELSELALETIAKLRGRDPHRVVQVVVAPRLSLYADKELLGVVLDNLLGNAWKYTAKAVNASIELGAIEHAGESIYYVRDNGAGFDPQYAHKLFQPFQRLHHQKEFPGTGIGLATVARVIHRHGGRIWAEGTPGAGATFYFTLPKTKPVATVQSSMATATTLD